MYSTKNIAFVVHRAAPYPGGSENYVHWMAKEAASRGHNVKVIAQTHQGNYDGIEITDDVNQLKADVWADLVVIHGLDVGFQNYVMEHAQEWAPVVYLIVRPTYSTWNDLGCRQATFIGWSTLEDLLYVTKTQTEETQKKLVHTPHGLPSEAELSNYVITDEEPRPVNQQYYISTGGFWPHKGHQQLVDWWVEFNNDPDTYPFVVDTTLVLTGYTEIQTVGKIWNNEKTNSSIFVIQMDQPGSYHNIISMVKNSEGYIFNSSDEGYGLVAIEALINGTPLIVRGQGIPALLEIRELPIVKEYIPDDMQSLGKAIMDLRDLKDPNLGYVYNEMTKSYVRTAKGIDKTIDGIEKCLRRFYESK